MANFGQYQPPGPPLYNPYYYQPGGSVAPPLPSQPPPPLPPTTQMIVPSPMATAQHYAYPTNYVPNTATDVSQHEQFGVAFDPTYPAELLSLFQPLYCKLCLVPISSQKNAYIHYNSKKHDMKVRKYLFEYARRTGLPYHFKLFQKDDQKEELDAKYLFCEICNVKLTSKIHAEDHYSGKNHLSMVQSGRKTSALPKASKLYKISGSESVAAPAPVIAPVPITTATTTTMAASTSTTTTAPQIGVAIEKKPGINHKFYCKLCDLYTSSKENLETHYVGQRHRKAVRKMLKSRPKQSQDLLLMENRREQNLSNFRTPSGQYYCELCKATIQNEGLFRQHLSSKKHFANKLKV